MANLNMDVSNIKPHEGFGDVLSEGRDTTRRWSKFQEAIFNFVSTASGNAIVVAVAGSGKSTTIIEAMKLVQGSSIFLAFNKAIADELKAKGVNARTFHSMVFGPVMRAKNAKDVTMDKLRRLCKQEMSTNEFFLYAAFAQKVVGLARQQGVGFLTPDVLQTYLDICIHHDIEPDKREADFDTALSFAQQLLGWSNDSDMVDFDDMLYWAVRDGINLPKFDFIFVDEAQDTNMIQRKILKLIMKPTSRLIAVGDPAQAIYGFRGSDSDSLDLIAQEFNCVELPLSISYRCPELVVNYAQQWVSHIQAAPNAPQGIVEHLGRKWEPAMFRPNDLIVCRKTAPLLTTAFKLIRANVPVQVLGKEIGQGLKTLIKKMNAKTLDQLTEKLQAFMMREVAKAKKDDDEAYADRVTDKVGCVLFLIDGLREDKRSIEQLEIGIDWLFKDKEKCVKLCTGHKSKGLEAKRVFWLNRSECPAQWARRGWQLQQEINICYVIATRAMEELYMIELGESEYDD